MKFKLFSGTNPVIVEKDVNMWITSNNPQHILSSSVSFAAVSVKSNSVPSTKNVSKEFPLIVVGVWYN